MKYLLAWLFPPLGMLACNRPGLAAINFLLCITCVGYPFAALWAYVTAAETNADNRARRYAR